MTDLTNQHTEEDLRIELLIVARNLRQTLTWVGSPSAETQFMAQIPSILARLDQLEKMAEDLYETKDLAEARSSNLEALSQN